MTTRSDYNKEEPIGGSVSSEPTHAVSNGGEVQQRIAIRAYELYRERGSSDGRALDDWLEAEQAILGREGNPKSFARSVQS